jgi:hypothetical protein
MIRSAAATLLIGLMAAPAAAERACLAFPWTGPAASTGAMSDIVALGQWLGPTLAEAPAIAAALAQVSPDLCLAPRLDGAMGFMDAEGRQIVLGLEAAPGLRRGILLHELRHLDQFARGYCPGNDLAPDENARATLAIEADASAVSLMLAWQRRVAGDASAWEALAEWPQQADIAARFAAEMAAGADLRAAVAAAFVQWYADPARRESYHLASCSDYFDREDDGHLLRGDGALPADFLAWLCVLPDGTPYPCAVPVTP